MLSLQDVSGIATAVVALGLAALAVLSLLGHWYL